MEVTKYYWKKLIERQDRTKEKPRILPLCHGPYYLLLNSTQPYREIGYCHMLISWLRLALNSLEKRSPIVNVPSLLILLLSTNRVGKSK
jgi:hypothetical protein